MKAGLIYITGFSMIILLGPFIMPPESKPEEEKQMPPQVVRIQTNCIEWKDTTITVIPDTIKYVLLPYKQFKRVNR